jgi:murein DD-endopeptidase MepM/ murein hydrolase activator NlpD
MDKLTPAALAPYILRADPGAQGAAAPGADVAQEFEAQFIYQLLRQMRASMSLDGEDDGFGAETMGATIDIELARTLSRQGGIGLANLIAEAASRQGMHFGGSNTALRALEARSPGEPRLPESLPGPVSPRPVESIFEGQVTSGYGWRNDPFTGGRTFHQGVDIAMAYGVEVPAAEGGRVIAAGEQGRYGNTVVIEHPSGTQTRYAHLSEIAVQPGQAVAAGEVIGRAGKSGAATGPHLHFEVIVDSQRMDPLSREARASLGEHP